ncbi:MAG: hypothetical protein Q7R41_07615 [Phycisphaerales bacterium]|nr:hypothetical protein [Phycisphaerales bacterium]
MVSPAANGFSASSAEVIRIRQAGTGTAIGAALLLFFGFVQLARPTGTDLFSHAWLAVYYALRIGGVASAAIAFWLWTGHRPALIADAVLAVLLGAIFVLSGLAMLFDGGGAFQCAIITICGGMFVSSGFRNGRDYMQMIACGPAPSSGARLAHSPIVRQSAECRPSNVASLPERPMQRSASSGPPDSRTDPVSERKLGGSAAPLEQEAEDSRSTPDATAEPPPEGFLAAFARKKPRS